MNAHIRSSAMMIGLLFASITLGACDDGFMQGTGEASKGSARGEDAATVATSESETNPREVGGADIDPTLHRAMDCWALTHGSYFLHMSSAEMAQGLPEAGPLDYRAWANQAATLIRDSGGTLAQFDELKERYGTRLLDADERREVTLRLRTCIETTPRNMLDVEQPILTSAD